MPQLIFKGVEKEDIKSLSKEMATKLAEVIACPRDYFTFEIVNTEFVFDGEEVKAYPFVQINWFDRGQEVQDETAKVVYEMLKTKGYNDVDIFFTVLEEVKYYENGRHF